MSEESQVVQEDELDLNSQVSPSKLGSTTIPDESNETEKCEESIDPAKAEVSDESINVNHAELSDENCKSEENETEKCEEKNETEKCEKSIDPASAEVSDESKNENNTELSEENCKAEENETEKCEESIELANAEVHDENKNENNTELPEENCKVEENKPVQSDYIQTSIDDDKESVKRLLLDAKVHDLIERFNRGEVFQQKQSSDASYKAEYGVGKVGHIHQEKFQ